MPKRTRKFPNRSVMQSLDGTTSICPAGVFKVPTIQNFLNSVISFDGPPQEHSAFSSAGFSGEHPQEGAASFFSPQQQDCFCLDIVFLLCNRSVSATNTWFSTHAPRWYEGVRLQKPYNTSRSGRPLTPSLKLRRARQGLHCPYAAVLQLRTPNSDFRTSFKHPLELQRNVHQYYQHRHFQKRPYDRGKCLF